MKKVHGPPILFIAFSLFACVSQGANLTVSGNWTNDLDVHDLEGRAGTDFRMPIESDPSVVSVSVDGQSSWSVSVRISNISLPNGATLSVRRVNGGTCGYNVNGGAEYLLVGNQDQALFSGVGSCSNIGLQLMIDGLSILHGPGMLNAELVYTVQE